MKIQYSSNRPLFSSILLLSIFINIKVQAQASLEQRKFPIIELKGSGYDRGFLHGQQLKKEIGEVYAKWKSNIGRSTGKHPDTILNAFRSSINFEPIAQKYNPSILEELKGIAVGAGQPYEDVYAFQLIDEFWIYLDQLSHNTNHHCSGMGVAATKSQPAFIAQNLDLESYMHGYQVLLHIAETKGEPEQYIVSCAGLVALSGMNGKGVAVCLNTLMELQASKDGMPVAFIIRALLANTNPDEALQFLKTIKHASGQNYILGIIDSVYDFEASANEVVRFMPNENETSIVYHTNHALVNHDIKDWYRVYHRKVLTGRSSNGNSEVRFASLEQQLRKEPDEISPDLVKTILRSKESPQNPVCRTYSPTKGGFTFSSILYTLSDKRSIQLTYGSPDQAEYMEYLFQSPGRK